MIRFNELKVVDCDKSLLINIEVEDMSYYQDVYIDRILVETSDFYNSAGPSSHAIPVFVADDTQEIKEFAVEVSELALNELKLEGDPNIDINRTLFYVYVGIKGTVAPDVPCGMDDIWSIGVTANLKPIYTTSINLLNSYANNCEMPKELMDYMFRINAFDLALKTCNYTLANKYWTKFFGDRDYLAMTAKCGCGNNI